MENKLHLIAYILLTVIIVSLVSKANKNETTISTLTNDLVAQKAELDSLIRVDSMRQLKNDYNKDATAIQNDTPTDELRKLPKHMIYDEQPGSGNEVERLDLLGHEGNNIYYIVCDLSYANGDELYSNVIPMNQFSEDIKYKLWDKFEDKERYLRGTSENERKVTRRLAHVFSTYSDASRFLNSR